MDSNKKQYVSHFCIETWGTFNIFTWVDEILVFVPLSFVDKEKNMIKHHFKCNDIVEVS